MITTAEYDIPAHMMQGIKDYIEHGVTPGGFLSAVISNDLREAVARADGTNIEIIPQYVKFFYNHAPSPCWGSPERMDAWIEMHRARRIAESEKVQHGL